MDSSTYRWHVVLKTSSWPFAELAAVLEQMGYTLHAPNATFSDENSIGTLTSLTLEAFETHDDVGKAVTQLQRAISVGDNCDPAFQIGGTIETKNGRVMQHARVTVNAAAASALIGSISISVKCTGTLTSNAQLSPEQRAENQRVIDEQNKKVATARAHAALVRMHFPSVVEVDNYMAEEHLTGKELFAAYELMAEAIGASEQTLPGRLDIRLNDFKRFKAAVNNPHATSRAFARHGKSSPTQLRKLSPMTQSEAVNFAQDAVHRWKRLLLKRVKDLRETK